MQNQKEAVYAAVQSVTGQSSFDEKVELSDSEKATVVQIVTEGLLAKEVQMKDESRDKHNTEEKMTKYTKGMVKNWLMKDTRLTGGVKHVIKNPGSRAGSGDPVIKELKKLQSTLTAQDQIDSVQVEIDKRATAIKAEKTKDIKIDANLIPDELKDLLG